MRGVLWLRDPAVRVGGPLVGPYLEIEGPQGPRPPDADTLARVYASTRRIVLLVHGYNTDREEGLAALSALDSLLGPERPDDLRLRVLWPGDSRWGRISYPVEGFTADAAGERIAAFLADFPHLAEVVFAAHSLGCRVAAEAGKRMARRPRHPRLVPCLMAAAVDRDAFGREGRGGYRTLAQRSSALPLLISSGDRVLRDLYPAGDLLESGLCLFRLPPGEALGFHGPPAEHLARFPALEPHRAHPTCRVDHGDYLPDPGRPPSPQAKAAAAFVRDVLAGVLPRRWQMEDPCSGPSSPSSSS